MDFISEKVIEDIFTIDKSILAELLSVNPSELSLVSRQKILNSGKLDLLYLCNDELILIELKVVRFNSDIIKQIQSYYNDLIELQKKNKLIKANIRKYIFVLSSSENEKNHCQSFSINVIDYKPKEILFKSYENFKELSHFLKIQSGDYGVVRLSLLSSTINYISEGLSIKNLCDLEGKSEKTIKNRISIGILLNLISKYKGEYFLTELGNEFNSTYKKNADTLNQSQKELLSNFIKENPFYSSVSYTILSLVESVFVLSKNNYPVSFNSLKDYFIKSVGKSNTWKAAKAQTTATYIFSNHACELDFLIKISNNFYLTPSGIQMVLLLQLNRSIKLIESQ